MTGRSYGRPPPDRRTQSTNYLICIFQKSSSFWVSTFLPLLVFILSGAIKGGGTDSTIPRVFAPMGSAFNFSCEFSKYGSLDSRIFWYHNGRPIVNAQSDSVTFMIPRDKIDHYLEVLPDRIPNRRSSLEVKWLEAGDWGSYRCEIETIVPGLKRDGGEVSVSESWQLLPSTQPVVRLDRIDGGVADPLRVIEGQEVTLRCVVAGSDDTKVIWIFNGAVLDEFDGVTESKSQGGFTSILRRSFARDESHLDITCAAQNAFTRQTIRRDAVLQSLNVVVEFPPEKPFLVLDQNQWMKEGTVLPLTCMLHKNGEPKANLSLYMTEGRVLKPLRTRPFAHSSILTISTQLKILRRHHNATIVCEARSANPKLTVTSEVALKVAYGPDSVSIHNVRRTLAINEDVDATCEFSVTLPPPEIKWVLTRLANFDDASYNVTLGRDQHLRFRPTWRDNGAKLTCHVINDCGAHAPDLWNQMSSSVIIDVPHKPVWTGTPDQLTIKAREGSFVEIICRASGNPVPKVDWWFEGDQVSNNDPFSPFALKRTVALDTFGKYTCLARNEFGRAEFQIELVDSERMLKILTLIGGLVAIVIVTSLIVCCFKNRREARRKKKRQIHNDTMRAIDLKPNNTRGRQEVAVDDTPEYFQRGLYSNVRLSSEVPPELSYFKQLETTDLSLKQNFVMDPRTTDSDEGISRDNSLSDVSYQEPPAPQRHLPPPLTYPHQTESLRSTDTFIRRFVPDAQSSRRTTPVRCGDEHGTPINVLAITHDPPYDPPHDPSHDPPQNPPYDLHQDHLHASSVTELKQLFEKHSIPRHVSSRGPSFRRSPSRFSPAGASRGSDGASPATSATPKSSLTTEDPNTEASETVSLVSSTRDSRDSRGSPSKLDPHKQSLVSLGAYKITAV